MLVYDLDRLGWFDFEAAIEVLLKANLGLGVESWGSTGGDWGRDAYFKGTLRYPGADLVTGEFVFQCKFVQGANGAGAKPAATLLNAIKKECTRLKERRSAPSHYTLITNAPLTPALRERIVQYLSQAIPKAAIHVHGAADVCNLFDLTPRVARAFPQVFGIRHLSELLRLWSRPDLLKRSKLLLEHATDGAPTFVPTRAYRRALDVVRAHHFVVLEGPPEMGKTTLGCMLALAAIASEKMEAIECRRPRDLFDIHDSDCAQIFVVDDCFGRSSYDPSLGSEWERELGSILRLLDDRHWLVLTSRAHLLNFAISILDAERRAIEQLSRARVVIDARSLSELEKAQMLYRHSKHVHLLPARSAQLKSKALGIIKDEGFTPERIRILVNRLSTETELIEKLAKESLETPTESMRKSFRAIHMEHRWLMYALLEQEGQSTRTALIESYDRLCPEDARRPFDELAGQLNNAFIKKRETSSWIEVVHPTVLDLVAAELALDTLARRRYLEFCHGDGLHVALRVQGNEDGTAIAPLLVGETEWKLLEARAVAELRKGRAHATELLRIISQSKKKPTLQHQAQQTLKRVAAATIKELNGADLWTIHSALVFARAMRGSYVPLIDGVWKRQVLATHEELAGAGNLNEKYWRLQELSELANLVVHSGWAAVTNKSLLWVDICRTLEWIHTHEDWSNDLDDWGIDDDDIDELDNAKLDFETLEEIIENLRDCLPTSGPSDPELAAQIRRAVDHAHEMEAYCQQLRDETESRREDVVEPRGPSEANAQTERVVDIQSVLEDL